MLCTKGTVGRKELKQNMSQETAQVALFSILDALMLFSVDTEKNCLLSFEKKKKMKLLEFEMVRGCEQKQ